MTQNSMELIKSITSNTKTTKEWKAAVRRMHSLFGEDALYYINCDRFAEGEWDHSYARPCEVWDGHKKTHFGLQVMHSSYDEECHQWFSHGKEVFLLV